MSKQRTISNLLESNKASAELLSLVKDNPDAIQTLSEIIDNNTKRLKKLLTAKEETNVS